MTTRNIIITGVVLTMTLAFAAIASAYGNGWHMRGAFDQLTPEKQEVARGIFDKHHDKMITLRDAIWAKRLELDALSNSGNASRDDIQGLVGEITDLRTKMQTERDAMFAEVEEATGMEFQGRGFGMGGYGPGNCPGRSDNGGGRGYGRHMF